LRSIAVGGVLDLIDIALVVSSVWVLFVTCVLALIKAARIGDEALPETVRSPMPGHAGWPPAALPTTTRPRRGPAAGRFVGIRPIPRR
jgi:hypothetical protein